jgi:molybdate transport system substrate-binding protein
MGRRAKWVWLLSFILWACATGVTQAGQVSVAVAANVGQAAQDIAVAFERSTGHRAVLAVGSTGKFYAQIRQGAPFDVLLSADDETPARLEKEGFGVPGSRFTYAVGRLVLWSPKAGVVHGQGEVLRQSTDGRLALADPRLAPYGAAAAQVLERLNLTDRWSKRWVMGESVGQTYQFVASGNVALGFVALSQVWAEGRLREGSAWIVPKALHDELRQDAVVLQRGRDQPPVQAFMTFLRSDSARAILRARGYED